jgi:hypothetical protein
MVSCQAEVGGAIIACPSVRWLQRWFQHLLQVLRRLIKMKGQYSNH